MYLNPLGTLYDTANYYFIEIILVVPRVNHREVVVSRINLDSIELVNLRMSEKWKILFVMSLATLALD